VLAGHTIRNGLIWRRFQCGVQQQI